MTFSDEWEASYRQNAHMSTWPWSDLVSFVMRYARPTGPQFRVLELGCGAGANIPFFQHLGAAYHAIEGSPSITAMVREHFPAFAGNIMTGDFTKQIPFAGPFDLVVDRASLTHNTTASIRQCLDLVHERMRPGSSFIGIDWFSTRHTDAQQGEQDEDPYTRRGYTSGPFANVGKVHFSDREHLIDLFRKFDLTQMEHKTVQREIPATNYTLAFWNFVAVKPR
jgi:SAM-dependent methyltransferase